MPKDETPVITTIKDVEKLKADPFFADATNGDRLVIFQVAKQAILYRESERKIIKAGPVLLPDSAKKKISIIGGTEEAAAIQATLTKSFAADGEVIGTVAPTVGHESLTVVDVSGTNAQLAQKLATALNGTVAATMPAGETAPASAEIVIIATALAP